MDLDQRIYELNSSLAPFEVLNNQKCVISIEGHAVPADPILITRLAVSNAPADGTAFDTGDAINITATFSAAVTGELKLPVKIGNRTVVLEATAENSTTATFTHQVLSTDRDDDGITFDADRMTGTVNAVLAHPQLIASHAHSVNGLPTLRWVGITSDPGAGVWYTVGETIRADANFRRPIEVTGDPTLQFSTSAGATQMSYNAALSDEDSMVFTYLVQATDDDDNGIFIGANAIQLDSNDSIKDGWRTGADKKDAVITHGRPGANGFFRDHRISQQARISSVEVTSDPARGTNSDTYGYNDVIELTVTFNQDVTVTGDPVFKFSAGVFKGRRLQLHQEQRQHRRIRVHGPSRRHRHQRDLARPARRRRNRLRPGHRRLHPERRRLGRRPQLPPAPDPGRPQGRRQHQRALN